jgi:hypothetical protein
VTRLAIDEALPAMVALAVLVLADVLLDGWVVVAIMVVCLVAMFAAYGYRERSPSGLGRRAEWDRFFASLDPTETRALVLVRYGPLAAGAVVWVVAGFEALAFALGVLVAFLVVQAAFALWLGSRGHATR